MNRLQNKVSKDFRPNLGDNWIPLTPDWRPPTAEQVEELRQVWENYRARVIGGFCLLLMPVGGGLGFASVASFALWASISAGAGIAGAAAAYFAAAAGSPALLRLLDRRRPADLVGRVDSVYWYSFFWLGPMLGVLFLMLLGMLGWLPV